MGRRENWVEIRYKYKKKLEYSNAEIAFIFMEVTHSSSKLVLNI